MKTIIAGSRELPGDEAFIWYVADAVQKSGWKREIKEVVSGGARGIDLAGEAYAKDRGYTIKVFRPDWEGLGKRAGIVRNAQMADYADALIAIWDGRSKGTRNMIENMKSQGKKVYVYLVQ